MDFEKTRGEIYPTAPPLYEDVVLNPPRQYHRSESSVITEAPASESNIQPTTSENPTNQKIFQQYSVRTKCKHCYNDVDTRVESCSETIYNAISKVVGFICCPCYACVCIITEISIDRFNDHFKRKHFCTRCSKLIGLEDEVDANRIPSST